MKKIKSALVFVAVLILTFCCLFSACNKEQSNAPTDYEGLNFGIYYSENSEDGYIAIKSDNMAVLHNVDFIDVAEQGESSWSYDSENKIFSLNNSETNAINFVYNGTDEIEFNGIKYILNKEISMSRPIATITMENGHTITLELYPEKAPNTVNNFISLANSGFYDGIIFHRVISGFMIQGGDPAGLGTGGPGYHIAGEFAINGFNGNDIKHERGVISMARAYDPDSAGSQFFIMHKNASYLDGQYAAFGKVIEGMDTVDEIAETPVYRERPLTDQTMKSVRVETFGVNYPAPKKA